MAGDKIDIFGKSYYFQNNSGGSAANTAIPVLEILSGLLGSPAATLAASGHAGITATELSGMAGTTNLINQLLNDQTTDIGSSTIPKAYFNYLFFNEQLKCVGKGFSRVGDNSVLKDHHADLQHINVPANGFVYIYASNESPINVFFDNLQLVHTRGPLLEETHYYPFGLSIAGISSKSFGLLENKIEKFNGAEYNTTFDLNTYEFTFRNYDPQIGRWHSLDTKPTDDISLYSAMANNPIRYADPLGDTLALFRPDGTFWKFQDDGKKEFTGMFYQESPVTSTYEKDGVTYEVRTYSEGQAFQFNDPSVDVQAIKNGAITHVEIMSDAKVESQINKSGVKSSEAQASPISFANEQGRQGNMDYGVKGINSGDLKKNTFYIREKMAYNIGDVGNYLWGRGMAELGISLGTASIGAHVNNMVNGRSDNTPSYNFGPGTYGKPGLFDSQADQRAIHRGYANSPKGAILIKQELQNWPKYNTK